MGTGLAWFRKTKRSPNLRKELIGNLSRTELRNLLLLRSSADLAPPFSSATIPTSEVVIGSVIAKFYLQKNRLALLSQSVMFFQFDTGLCSHSLTTSTKSGGA